MKLSNTSLFGLMAALLFFSTHCTQEAPSPPAVDSTKASQPAPPVAEKVAGEKLLEMVNKCAKELHADSKGSGGNALRFDALSMKPYWKHFGSKGGAYELPEPKTNTWLVRIEEEHPHTQIPNGVEFTVNPDNGSCRHVMMD